MQKIGLKLSQQQRLSPQQILFMKLLEVPSAELESRIEAELEINPALEEGKEELQEDNAEENTDNEYETENDELFGEDDDNYLAEYMQHEEAQGYKMQGDGNYNDTDENKDMPLADDMSFTQSLLNQLGFLALDERMHSIGIQIIGSLDEDGYLRRKPESIANDLAFSQNLYIDDDEVLHVLAMIQKFDPAGIAARDLRECLLLQLHRKDNKDTDVINAISIVENAFDEFTKKHYDKILKKLPLSENDLKNALKVITKCNPKPGSGDENSVKNQTLIPDFTVTNHDGKLEVSLNAKNAPDLRVSPAYIEMFDTYDKTAGKDKKLKEAVTFVKQKLDAAHWFIDAIKQRQNTLLETMKTIVMLQKDFFITGDEMKLHPMVLKDVAEKLGMDVSTVSRVAGSKSVQTHHGTYALKYFFTEKLTTDAGEDISNMEVKTVLQQIIAEEDKHAPLRDEELEVILQSKGYNIARRTVAKYRELLDIPVARLRKEL
ncbi:MAG: RNA polymerase factor sigma-54 [Cytophagales bacterium]|nr:RNA polymerase factor sigma-54 [Cytophagales bacterium]